jgi:hypothetical protein
MGVDNESTSTGGDSPSADVLAELDRRFERLVRQASVDNALDSGTEDQVMPALLSAGLSALIAEWSSDAYTQDPLPGPKPALHARLRETVDLPLPAERLWSFRAIASGHPPPAVISRVRAASLAAGLSANVPQRALFLLRNGQWPDGPNTTAIANAFHDAGGRTLAISFADLRVFDALRVLQSKPIENLREWLLDRKPASSTEIFEAVFGGVRIHKRAQP